MDKSSDRESSLETVSTIQDMSKRFRTMVGGLRSSHNGEGSSHLNIQAKHLPQERLLGWEAARSASNELLENRTYACHSVCPERTAVAQSITQCLHQSDLTVRELLGLKEGEHSSNETTSELSGLSLTAESSFEWFIDATDFWTLFKTYESRILGADNLDDSAVHMLTYFMHVDSNGKVSIDDFWSLKALWMLYQDKRDDWKSFLQGDSVGHQSIWNACSKLNAGYHVKQREVAWISDLIRECWYHNDCAGESLEPALLALAYWYISPKAEAESGLDRFLLIERLNLEKKLKTGLLKFLCFLLWFGALTMMMTVTTKPAACRGISRTLDSKFKLDRLKTISTMRAVRQFFHNFSRLSQDFSPSSQEYFGIASEFMILDGVKTFENPVQLPRFNYVVGKHITLQAWIQIDSNSIPVGGLSILRKRLQYAGLGDTLSCWSWNFPPSFSYGAQDYGRSSPNQVTGKMEEHVELQDYGTISNGTREYLESRGPSHGPVLHTIVINSTSVTFMIDDGIVLGTVRLPRPVTDCSTEEVHLGDAGLTLLDVRFYSRSLSQDEVRNVFTAGSTMVDIGYVNPPEFLNTITPLESVQTDIYNFQHDLKDSMQKFFVELGKASLLTKLAVQHQDVEMNTNNENMNHPVSRLQDPVLKKTAWLIDDKPTYMTPDSLPTAPGNVLPDGNTGFTVSAWVKFDSDKGHGFHVARVMPILNEETDELEWSGWANLCWAMYLGGDWTSFHAASTLTESTLGTMPGYRLFDKRAPKDWQFQGKSWRHFAARVDQKNSTHPIIVCIDGECPGKSGIDDIASFINFDWMPPAVDCSQIGGIKHYTPEQKQRMLNASLIMLNRRPPQDWPMTAWRMRTKYFNTALSEEEIKKLFLMDPDPDDQRGRPIRQVRGCRIGSELGDDRTWKDSFGNGCYWYFVHNADRPEVCEKSKAARTFCPMACRSAEVCWGAVEPKGKEMTIWNLQMEFKSKGPWGTTCVGKSTTAAKEAIKCGKGVPIESTAKCHSLGIKDCTPVDCSEYEEDHVGLMRCLGDRVWLPQNHEIVDSVLPCRDIVALHEPFCDWDDSELDNVASEINKTQEWSISFWMEPLRPSCREPQLRLIDGHGHTFSILGPMLHMNKDRPGYPGCNEKTWVSHTIIGRRPELVQLAAADIYAAEELPKGTKQFVVFGRNAEGSAMLTIDNLADSENPSYKDSLPPIFSNKDFLRVINVGGDIRMGAWTLRPHFPSQSQIGNWRFTHIGPESLKRGPSTPIQTQLSTEAKISRNTDYFTQNLILVSPVMLVQKRLKSGPCQSDFAQDIINIYMERNERRHCQSPYDCGDYDASHVYTCAGEVEDGRWFGLNPQTFQDETVYVDYLTAIAGSNILGRDGELVDGSVFLDGLTSKVNLIALFLSVQTGVLSQLKIVFDAQDGSVRPIYNVEQYMLTDALKDQRLTIWTSIIVFVLCLIWCLVMDFHIFLVVWRGLLRKWLSLADISVVLWNSLDLVVAGFGAFFLGKYYYCTFVSDGNLGDLVAFDWHRRYNYEETAGQYVKMLGDVEDRISAEFHLRKNAIYLSILILLRLLLSTGMHPRIALITHTVMHAGNELVHFGVISFVIFIGFAAMGSWRFGPTNANYDSIKDGIFFQIDAILGPPGGLDLAEISRSTDYYVFASCFQLLCFIFMLNFVLAIIVSAYDRVIDDIKANAVGQDTVSDVVSIVRLAFTSKHHKWPAHDAILHVLRSQIAAKYIRTNDMEKFFGDLKRAKSFTHYYSRFPALVHHAGSSSDSKDEDADALNKLQQDVASVCHRVDNMQRGQGLMVDQLKSLVQKLDQLIPPASQQSPSLQHMSDEVVQCETCKNPQSSRAKFCNQCGSRVVEACDVSI